MIRKESAHFLDTLEIKLRHITHPLFVMHHLPGADADHDVVRFMMVALEKMHIVRRDQSEPEFLGDRRKNAIALSLRLEAVIVQLEKEIFRPKNIPKSC